ncbi:MAG: hypothetical protein K6U87_17080 [Firmicutes bacterium]|nr:hypothetical protein [Bacillota bacterium]
MAREIRSYLALVRFAHALARLEAVDTLYFLEVGEEMHAWVVMRRLERADRHAVFAAQMEADPNFLLILHLTDCPKTVPADAGQLDLKPSM